MTAGRAARPFITLTTDFGWGSQGVGVMKAVIYFLAADVQVIDVTHEVTPFSTIDGASELEALATLPQPGIHVCVVDPGVGGSRRVVSLETQRGDILIGPDNGVLIPAARAMGGIVRAIDVVNREFMLDEVSSTFHGRDVMVPAAAAVATGVDPERLGHAVPVADLAPAPFDEADWSGDHCRATIVHVNRYGTAYLNVLNSTFAASPLADERCVVVACNGGRRMNASVGTSFSDVPLEMPILFPGHYRRMQMAVNQGSFIQLSGVALGSTLDLHPAGSTG